LAGSAAAAGAADTPVARAAATNNLRIVTEILLAREWFVGHGEFGVRGDTPAKLLFRKTTGRGRD